MWSEIRPFVILRQWANKFYYTRKCSSNVRIQTTMEQLRCEPHMNELPVPCGSWDAYYNNRQTFYNRVLAIGVIWWLISLAFMIYTGSMFLNWSAPINPSSPTDMMAECEDNAPGIL